MKEYTNRLQVLERFLAQCRGMLFQIFNKAEANDLVKKNPVRFAEKMRKKPPKRKECFTAEEVHILLKELPEDRIGWSIRLLLCTGMRTQELLGLEPRHIAEDGSSITIEQAVVMVKGTAMIGTPKSFDSYRCVPVPKAFRYCARLLRSLFGKCPRWAIPAILRLSEVSIKQQSRQLKV